MAKLNAVYADLKLKQQKNFFFPAAKAINNKVVSLYFFSKGMYYSMRPYFKAGHARLKHPIHDKIGCEFSS